MRSLLKSLVQVAAGFGLSLGLLSIRIFPRRFFLFLAQAAADLGFYLFRRFRTRSTRNVTLALGDQLDARQIDATVRSSLRNFFRDFVEIGFALETGHEKIRTEIPVVGRAHLEAALAKGKGAIALSAHLGNFFLVGTRLSAEGYVTSVLVNQPADGYFGRLMDRWRLRVGQRTIHARPRRLAFHHLVQALRRNEITVVIADEYRSGSGLFVPFFGRTVAARRGPATLALRTGAALVPMYLIRKPDGGLMLIIEPEIELATSGAIKADVRENTLRIVAWLEKTVSAYPDQWNWMNVRWHRPPLAPAAGKEPRYEGST
ncbi:MAG: lysophospholipid acyltransferase family protein [Deltaproteobacteria bacterium]|nr:lysophospholipid acyltransferase family protein [Deltaproteobacteria bacterium]